MRLGVVCLVLILTLSLGAESVSAVTPKPWQWTTAQAGAALMRQAEDFYFSERGSVDLTSARCRGTGKSVQRRFVSFTCSVVAPNGQEYLNLRVSAKTRRAGGLCWAVAPTPVPFGCLLAGKRAEGSPRDAWIAAYRVIDDRYVQGGRCLAHGSGFFSCSWTDAEGAHRGTVVFKPAPVVKVLS